MENRDTKDKHELWLALNSMLLWNTAYTLLVSWILLGASQNQVGLIPGIWSWFNIRKSINSICWLGLPLTNHHKLGSLNTEIYCLTDLEARCPRAVRHQGWVLLRVVREDLPCAFLRSFRWFAGNLWHSLACRSITWSLPSSSYGVISVRTLLCPNFSNL